jgi:Uncharacterised nucleotidyltransferase
MNTREDWAAQIAMLGTEFAIVAACCCPVGGAGRAAAIKAAAQRPHDAERLLALASAHRVEALVEHGLREADVMLEEEASRHLAERAHIARLQMLRNAGEEVRLSTLFRDAGIDAVFVKGASTAMLAHGSLALKSCWDIDLLVAREQCFEAGALLSREGYVFDQPGISGQELQTRFVERNRETCWYNRARGTYVELHWALSENPLLISAIGMRSPRQSVAISGNVAVVTLANDELFAFLCAHGSVHGWSRLKWLADAVALLARHDTDGQLVSRAMQVGPPRAIAQALTLADIFGWRREVSPLKVDSATARLITLSLRIIAKRGRIDVSDLADPSFWLHVNLSHFLFRKDVKFKRSQLAMRLRTAVTARRLSLPRWLLPIDALLITAPIGLISRILRSVTLSGRVTFHEN